VPTRDAAADIRDLVVPIVDALGCRLYDVEVTGAGKSRTVRVLVDREGGIDLDQVTAATRAISEAIDHDPGIGGPFLLEVSSPGLERPLRVREHFERAIGETVTIGHHTDDGPRRVRGVLVEAGADAAVVEVDGQREAIPYDRITKARTVFEWGPPPRERAKRSKRGRAKERA
jgi:ribosome maturation factor RimP